MKNLVPCEKKKLYLASINTKLQRTNLRGVGSVSIVLYMSCELLHYFPPVQGTSTHERWSTSHGESAGHAPPPSPWRNATWSSHGAVPHHTSSRDAPYGKLWITSPCACPSLGDGTHGTTTPTPCACSIWSGIFWPSPPPWWCGPRSPNVRRRVLSPAEEAEAQDRSKVICALHCYWNQDFLPV